MRQQPIPGNVADQTSEERWAAWQARGAANDRATKRRWFVVGAILVLAAAILNGLWLLS